VGEFDGAGKGMLLTPGEYAVKVVFLGGDQEFEEKVKDRSKEDDVHLYRLGWIIDAFRAEWCAVPLKVLVWSVEVSTY